MWFNNCEADREARPEFVSWYLPGMHDGKIYPVLLFRVENWSELSLYVKPKNNKFPLLIDEALVHGFRVGVWCAISATKIIGPIFLFSL